MKLLRTGSFSRLGKGSVDKRLTWQLGYCNKAKGIMPRCHTGKNPVCPLTFAQIYQFRDI
jgi:hypothetical protein